MSADPLYVRRRRRPEINIVPLIDVLTMLIFFFLVSMQFREITTLNLTLPKVETAGHGEFKSPLVVGVDTKGAISINGQVVADPAALAALVQQVAAADKNVTVLIRADEGTALKEVTTIMDACRKTGLNKIRLQTR